MAIINLRDFYPHYNTDVFVEVADNVADTMHKAERKEAAYQLRTYRHKAYYSLNRCDEIEGAALFAAISPCEELERKQTLQALGAAFNALPATQARRVYAHYILGESMVQIAADEGVAKSRITESIQRGLRNMKQFLEMQP